MMYAIEIECRLRCLCARLRARNFRKSVSRWGRAGGAWCWVVGGGVASGHGRLGYQPHRGPARSLGGSVVVGIRAAGVSERSADAQSGGRVRSASSRAAAPRGYRSRGLGSRGAGVDVSQPRLHPSAPVLSEGGVSGAPTGWTCQAGGLLIPDPRPASSRRNAAQRTERAQVESSGAVERWSGGFWVVWVDCVPLVPLGSNSAS